MRKLNPKTFESGSNACRKTDLLTLDLDQKLLKKDMEVLLKRGGGIKCKRRLVSLKRVQTKSKDLNQSHCKAQIERIMMLFKLNIIVNLKVFGDILAAGFGVFGVVGIIFVVIHWHSHAAIEVFFAKTNFRFHRMAHAKMCRFRHPDGGEEHEKGKRYRY